VIWVNAIIAGVLLGGLYALFACGLSLMYGVMRIINLAHGDLAVMGAYLVLVLATFLGVSPLLVLPVAVVVMAILGYVLQRTLLERSLRAGPLVPLLTTFGLAIVIQNLLLEVFTADSRSIDGGALTTASIKVSDQLSIPVLGIVIFALAVGLLGGLQLFLGRTDLGRSMRATAQDPDTAELIGIDSRHMYGLATAIAVGTVTIAGTFFGMRASFSPLTGPTQLIFAFEAVVIGGIGSLWGTLVGGVVLGVAQTIGAQINPQYPVLFGNLVFLAVLIARSSRRIGGLIQRT
jgi:branched-chain amino acid transport system permease protein